MRGGDQRLDRVDLGVEICAEHHVRVGKRLHNVYNDQRRAFSETDRLPESAFLEEFFVALL
jgi:hypothetical protein